MRRLLVRPLLGNSLGWREQGGTDVREIQGQNPRRFIQILFQKKVFCPKGAAALSPVAALAATLGSEINVSSTPKGLRQSQHGLSRNPVGVGVVV